MQSADCAPLHSHFVYQTLSRPPNMAECNEELGAFWLRANIHPDAECKSTLASLIFNHLTAINKFTSQHSFRALQFDCSRFEMANKRNKINRNNINHYLEKCYDRDELNANIPGRHFPRFEEVTFGDLRSRSDEENIEIVINALKVLGTKARPVLEYAAVSLLPSIQGDHQMKESYYY